jgi:hypothetical protein
MSPTAHNLLVSTTTTHSAVPQPSQRAGSCPGAAPAQRCTPGAVHQGGCVGAGSRGRGVASACEFNHDVSTMVTIQKLTKERHTRQLMRPSMQASSQMLMVKKRQQL